MKMTEDNVLDTIVNLNYSGLDDLPDYLLEPAAAEKVNVLYLKRNRLTKLPENISQLTNLTILYLHGNNIQCLPKCIGGLKNLQQLDISNNYLREFPEEIGNLAHLHRLHASNNSLEHLPNSIGNLLKLEILGLMNNILTTVPVEIGYLSSLKILNLDNNRLNVIPKQICKLGVIQEISASGNDLLFLPQNIGDVESLQNVFVDDNNHLTYLPMSLGPCSNRRPSLGTNGCGIFNPPDEIIKTLRHLVISSETLTRIIVLPPEIVDIRNQFSSKVASLTEMSLRLIHGLNDEHQIWSNEDLRSHLPKHLVDVIGHPTAMCPYCQKHVFISAFPVVLKHEHITSVSGCLFLGLCCSVHCQRQLFTSTDNLHFVYPYLEDLCLAVMLV